MTAKPAPADVLCFDGQSLVITPGTATAYPAKVQAERPGDLCPVVARGATSWAARLAAPAHRVDQYLHTVAGEHVYIDCGGTYEIANGVAAATAIANAEAMWDARRAAGWDRIIATTIPHSTAYDAAAETARATVNAAIVASLSLDDALDLAAIEVAGVAVFEDASNLTYWNEDGVHWRAAATTLVAEGLVALIP